MIDDDIPVTFVLGDPHTMPARLFAMPRRSARRLGARSTGLGLAAAFLLTQLTLGGAWAGSTGHEGLIVYSSVDRNGPGADLGNSDLYLTSAHSNTDRRLTSTPESEGTPSWSPDGSRIAFVRHHQDANGVSLGMWIYSIDPNTGTETLLTNAGSFTWPSWSPDGSQLVFGGQLFAGGGDGIANNIFAMSSNGGEIRQLTFGPFADTSPVWSPNGEQIAFSSNRAGPGSQIWLMNADGSGQHVVESALAYAQAPDWSPDGMWLAVFGVLGGATNPELFKMRPDGTGLTQLTSMPTEGKEDPTWSPDGSLVLFNAYAGRGSRGARSSELMVVPAGGGTAELFGPGVRHLLGQLAPDWTP
jgi:Tol biopolymer transport system component